VDRHPSRDAAKCLEADAKPDALVGFLFLGCEIGNNHRQNVLAGDGLPIVDDKQLPSLIAIAQGEAHLGGVDIIGVLDHLNETLERLDIESCSGFRCRPECSLHRARRMAQGVREGIDHRIGERRGTRIRDPAHRRVILPD
jgi:hypothetical protein